LGKGHTEKLVPTGKSLDRVVAVVPLDALAKFVTGEEVHQLRKDRFPEIHEPSPSALMREYGFLAIQV